MTSIHRFAKPHVHAAALVTALAIFAVTSRASAAEPDDYSGWSVNFTPVIIPGTGGYHLGGGADPELKYTIDRGGARLSAGLRVGGYYAKNLFGVMLMPTLRITVPVGPVEPYAAFGLGYGWIIEDGHDDLARMSRLGVVFRVSRSVALGIEGTLQEIDHSAFRFPSLGSMVAIEF